MSTTEGGVRRRLFFLLVVPVALVVLVFIGRTPNSAATPSTDSTVPSADAQGLAVETAGDSSPDSPSVDAPAIEAIEIRPDGAVVVDLNHATEEELRKLPGVGPRKARAIIELRARIGGLKRIEDLARIKGFGRTILRRLRPFVRLAPPK